MYICILNVKSECKKMGLCLNSKKTKVMAFNTEDTPLKTVESQNLQVIEDFKYLGSWINSPEKDIRVRKGLSWNALHSIRTLWKSSIIFHLKEDFLWLQ